VSKLTQARGGLRLVRVARDLSQKGPPRRPSSHQSVLEIAADAPRHSRSASEHDPAHGRACSPLRSAVGFVLRARKYTGVHRGVNGLIVRMMRPL